MRKLKDINWNQVYYFYEVARKMSMKEAAEVTGVSIPTVSEQIKRLETLLETPLFHRRPRRIELTTEGETLFRYAKMMFEAGLRFLDVVSPTLIGGYPVRVGVQEGFAGSVEIDFLLRYFEVFSPFGTVHTISEKNSDRMLEMINNGEIDWGMTLTPPNSPRLEYGKVASPEIVFIASNEIAEKYKNRVEIFQNLPLARSRHDEQLNKLVTDHLQSSDVYVEEVIESDHWDFCVRLAEQGRCVMAVAKNLVDTTLTHADLQTFTLGGPMVLNYYAVWRQTSNRMIAVRKLIDLLEKENKVTRSKPVNETMLPGMPLPTQNTGSSLPDEPLELPHQFSQDLNKYPQ
jgi:DNA-binding transcriptional LysR family regulator